MMMRRALATLALMLFAPLALAGPRPELDASQGQRPSTATRTLATRARASVAGLATPSSYDERYGVPTMIWADRASDLTTAKGYGAVPVPEDHVLNRAFYLLNELPGRFAGGQVWVARDQDRANDSVSPVI